MRVAPIVVAAIALAVRLGFVEEHPPGLYVVSDMEFYDRRAAHLLSGDWSVWDTFTPVGYPALLAVLYAVIGKSHAAVGVAQAVVGATTAVLAGAITARVTRSRVAGVAVGVLLAVYAPLVMYTGFLLTETVFSFLLALAVWLLFRAMDEQRTGFAVAAGAALGIAAAVRPNLLIALPLLAACSLIPRASRVARRAPLIAALCALPFIAGVAVHNTRLAGRAAGLATNGGLNFFLGHCECRAVRFPPGGKIGEVSGYHNRKRYTEIIQAPVPAYDEGYFYRAGLSLLAREPARIVRGLANVADGFALSDLGPLPAQPYWPGWNGHEVELRRWARAALWLAFAPAVAMTLWMAIKRRLSSDEEAPRLLLIAILASAPITLYLFLGDPRLRVSFDPLAFALAADAWLVAGRWARARLSGAAS